VRRDKARRAASQVRDPDDVHWIGVSVYVRAPRETHRARLRRRWASRQAVDLLLHAPKTASDLIQPAFDATESRLDGSKVVAVAARLFENMARHHSLALDLVLEHGDTALEFLSSHVRRQPTSPANVVNQTITTFNSAQAMRCLRDPFFC
jgi:hypothetical protein